ncbi:DUF397 domain-containing protein [Actinomadura rupiterrae]|uniref:DUF397 domain-containing protein n=1 Tax=Actinomadura rupiterrae TaxID=559627 RepID=UPI0020A42486|nr:DUF397 domain-containing protein [Actinomadura rupiterrae]MCP2341223.1 hypothetical protein [Actinomadura rupiterrae]
MTRDTKRLTWRKSSYSAQSQGNCIEVAPLVTRAMLLTRDSKDPDGPVLTLNRSQWASLLAAVRDR